MSRVETYGGVSRALSSHSPPLLSGGACVPREIQPRASTGLTIPLPPQCIVGVVLAGATRVVNTKQPRQLAPWGCPGGDVRGGISPASSSLQTLAIQTSHDRVRRGSCSSACAPRCARLPPGHWLHSRPDDNSPNHSHQPAPPQQTKKKDHNRWRATSRGVPQQQSGTVGFFHPGAERSVTEQVD